MTSPYPHEWALRHGERAPDSPAVSTPTIRLTYADLADRTRRLAANLARSGVTPGDRVLVALPNRPATVIASLAVNELGAAAVEVNREWDARVLGEIVAHSGVRQAFISVRDVHKWAAALAGRRMDLLWIVTADANPGSSLDPIETTEVRLLLEDGRLAAGSDAGAMRAQVRLDPDSPAVVLYTSGSTGRPHGVIQTYRNVEANTRSIVEYLGLSADDRALLTLPLFYSYGRSVLQTHLLVGGSVFLDDRFAFPRIVMEALSTEGCTGFAGVPLTYEIIRRNVDVSSISYPRLRYVTQAGGAMAAETIEWARQAFAPSPLFVMYGQTEATARLTYLPPERALDKQGSIGIPIPGVELQVMGADGHQLPDGEVGELVARGANVTPGYLGEPEETAAILHNGWLWTGDLGYRDADGFYYHLGRTKEILKIGGHRISPVEIEEVVARHPDVDEAAVIGIPHDILAEAPYAFVVARPGATPSRTELRRFCQERLPAYAIPVEFDVVRALPRNAAGKLMRSELSLRHKRAAQPASPANPNGDEDGARSRAQHDSSQRGDP